MARFRLTHTRASAIIYILNNKAQIMFNRYGDSYQFEKIDYDNLGFVDPSGGPFIELGSKIENREITRIFVKGEQTYFEVAS